MINKIIITLTILLSITLTDNTNSKSIIHSLHNSVMIITNKSQGSGFISSKYPDFIITNKHVVEHSSSVYYRASDGLLQDSEIIYMSSVYDLALIRLNNKKDGIEHCKSSDVKIYQDMYNIGNPAGYEFTITKGYISASKRKLSYKYDNHDYLVTNLIGFSGQSGSALIKADEHCIAGVLTRANLQAEIGFSIPVEIIDAFMSDYKNNKNSKKNVIKLAEFKKNDVTEVVMLNQEMILKIITLICSIVISVCFLISRKYKIK